MSRKGNEARALEPEVEKKRQARRNFLKAAGALVATAGLGASCRVEETGRVEEAVLEPSTPLTSEELNPNVPPTPSEPPPPGTFYVFTPHEAATVEALTARLLPGTPDDPGAREAGVVSYIDGFLAYHEGFAEPTYRHPPYAMTYAGDRPPPETGALEAYQVVWIPADQIVRYGYQSILNPREVYRLGVASVDRYSQNLFGRDFVALSEEQQDGIIADMAAGQATGFDKLLPPESFFHNLRRHTVEGMFSDPAYGGNREMVGWKLVGYPGAQRAYTPQEYRTEGTDRQPQSSAQMHAFNPGQPANRHVILPVSGKEMQHP